MNKNTEKKTATVSEREGLILKAEVHLICATKLCIYECTGVSINKSLKTITLTVKIFYNDLQNKINSFVKKIYMYYTISSSS